ncbi:MAG: hypothetical protein AAFW60_00650 [Pseudomonadota bacterium]
MSEAKKPSSNNLHLFVTVADINVPAEKTGTREVKAGVNAKKAKLTVQQTAKYLKLGLIAAESEIRKGRAKSATNDGAAIQALKDELDTTNAALEKAELLLSKAENADALTELQGQFDEVSAELEQVKAELEEANAKVEETEGLAAKAGEEIKRLQTELEQVKAGSANPAA